MNLLSSSYVSGSKDTAFNKCVLRAVRLELDSRSPNKLRSVTILNRPAKQVIVRGRERKLTHMEKWNKQRGPVTPQFQLLGPDRRFRFK